LFLFFSSLTTDDIENIEKNPEIMRKLNQGIDLRAYSRDIETELRTVEREAIEDCTYSSKEKQKFLEPAFFSFGTVLTSVFPFFLFPFSFFCGNADVGEAERMAMLYNEITTCEAVLEKLEDFLSKFQADISNIGDEIKQLQDKCMSSELKLKNRKARKRKKERKKFAETILLLQNVKELLAKFVEQVAVAKDLKKYAFAFLLLVDFFFAFFFSFKPHPLRRS
jgi:hypothetical protein